VRVVNTKNGRSVVVRINDRVNPRTQAREHDVIDLSRGSARALGIEGVGSVALYTWAGRRADQQTRRSE